MMIRNLTMVVVEVWFITKHVTDGWYDVHEREAGVDFYLTILSITQIDHHGNGEHLVTKLELVLQV